jgi:23S rRNA (adenine2030-N6)-methyltransferase
VLIDPSYELERDYARVIATLRDALARFAEGVYIVWYPQVGRVAARELPRRLQAIAPKGWLHARLTVQQPDARGFGMAGSGVFVFNPPHTLHAALAQALPWLHENLRQFDGGSWLLDQRAV